jgi:hypothetical protein
MRREKSHVIAMLPIETEPSYLRLRDKDTNFPSLKRKEFLFFLFIRISAANLNCPINNPCEQVTFRV